MLMSPGVAGPNTSQVRRPRSSSYNRGSLITQSPTETPALDVSTPFRCSTVIDASITGAGQRPPRSLFDRTKDHPRLVETDQRTPPPFRAVLPRTAAIGHGLERRGEQP